MTNQWRTGQDSKAHLIIGCDPSASAWTAVCGKLITGKPSTEGELSCKKCMAEAEKLIAADWQMMRLR